MSTSKIMYLTFNDPYASPGVHKKEREFCAHMERLCRERGVVFRGVNVFTSEYASLGRLEEQGPLVMREVRSRLHERLSHVRFVRAFSRMPPLLRGASDEVRVFDPDLVFWRYDIINVPGIFTPKRLKPGVLFVTEHQTKEMEELAFSLTGRIKSPLMWCYEKGPFQQVDALVGVTSEIADYERAKLRREVPVYVHTNGIDVAACPLSPHVPFTREALRMVYVGTSTPHWQGVDRLVEGLAAYRGAVSPELHLVGHVTPELEGLIRERGLTQAVHLHGMLHGTALDELLAGMHLAVGTLGIHRKGLACGCTLKVREYMARGLPFIISHIDEDIEDDFPFCLRLGADERPVDLQAVVRFLEGIEQRYGADTPSRMRSYALEHMDYADKVRRLLDFLLSLARAREGRS